MKLSKLLEKIDCAPLTSETADLEIKDVCSDSRKAGKGCLFVCVKGLSSDGHEYAKSAQDAGAAAIVAEHKTQSTLPHIIVKDSRTALPLILAALFGHPEKSLKLIGVTGTNGKTSTTCFIKDILDSLGAKTGLIGTIKNMIGNKELKSSLTTPEPYELFEYLAKMKSEGMEYAIMEVSSHSLAQKRVYGLEFEVGVFTNLTQDHLDFHGSMENYRAAKAELFEMSKTCIFNIDDETGAQFYNQCQKNKLSYSTIYDSADFVAKDIRATADGVEFIALKVGEIGRVSFKTPGMFTVYNALAAIAAVSALGYEFSDICRTSKRVGSVPGRAQVIDCGMPFTVMLDYAHTPDGLRGILSAISGIAKGRLVTLFGCGGDRDKSKRPIMAQMAAQYSDFLIVTSDNPRTEDPLKIIDDILKGLKGQKTPYVVIPNRREAIFYALKNAKPDDIILLAGKGHEKYQILGTKKVDFDEQQIVHDCLLELKKEEGK